MINASTRPRPLAPRLSTELSAQDPTFSSVCPQRARGQGERTVAWCVLFNIWPQASPCPSSNRSPLTDSRRGRLLPSASSCSCSRLLRTALCAPPTCAIAPVNEQGCRELRYLSAWFPSAARKPVRRSVTTPDDVMLRHRAPPPGGGRVGSVQSP
jgi:hypothetical protein